MKSFGGSVRKENIASIRSAIARLDYRVNPIARILGGLHGAGAAHQGNAPVAFGGQAADCQAGVMASDRVLRERGYHSMISCYYADHGLERDYLSYLMNTGADGLIYVPENLTAEEFQELTAHRDIPVVQVDRMIPGVDSDTAHTSTQSKPNTSTSSGIRSPRSLAAVMTPMVMS